jgi:hypothetical protein
MAAHKDLFDGAGHVSIISPAGLLAGTPGPRRTSRERADDRFEENVRCMDVVPSEVPPAREQVRRGRTASLNPCVNRHCLFCSDRNCFHSLQCVKSNIGGKDEAAALIEQLFSTHQSFTRAGMGKCKAGSNGKWKRGMVLLHKRQQQPRRDGVAKPEKERTRKQHRTMLGGCHLPITQEGMGKEVLELCF